MKADMLLKPLLFAATAASFLIPGDLPETDEGAVKILPVEIDGFIMPPYLTTTFAQSVDVPCRHCKGRDVHLKMDFTVEDGSRLTLNGFELYPHADPFHGDLVATVVRPWGRDRDRQKRLGYSLAVKPVGVDSELQMEIIGIDLRIIEVGNKFVQDIPTVDIKLIKAPTGEILLGRIEIQEEQPGQCESLWCRVKHFFGNTSKGFRGCSKSHNRPPKPITHHHTPGPHGDGHMQHHQSGHHGDGSRDSTPRPHTWREVVMDVATHVFLPGLMGLVAGICLAVVTTIIWTSVIHLVRFLGPRRREGSWCGRCAVRSQPTQVDDAAIQEEKVGLMEHYSDLEQAEDHNEKN